MQENLAQNGIIVTLHSIVLELTRLIYCSPNFEIIDETDDILVLINPKTDPELGTYEWDEVIHFHLKNCWAGKLGSYFSKFAERFPNFDRQIKRVKNGVWQRCKARYGFGDKINYTIDSFKKGLANIRSNNASSTGFMNSIRLNGELLRPDVWFEQWHDTSEPDWTAVTIKAGPARDRTDWKGYEEKHNMVNMQTGELFFGEWQNNGVGFRKGWTSADRPGGATIINEAREELIPGGVFDSVEELIEIEEGYWVIRVVRGKKINFVTSERKLLLDQWIDHVPDVRFYNKQLKGYTVGRVGDLQHLISMKKGILHEENAVVTKIDELDGFYRVLTEASDSPSYGPKKFNLFDRKTGEFLVKNPNELWDSVVIRDFIGQFCSYMVVKRNGKFNFFDPENKCFMSEEWGTHEDRGKILFGGVWRDVSFDRETRKMFLEEAK